MFKEITSPANEKIKWLVKLLHNSAFRRDQNLFVVEGVKEIKMALGNDFKPHSLFVLGTNSELSEQFTSLPCFSLAQAAFEKAAYRKTSQALAVFHAPQRDLSFLKLSPTPLLIIAESIEKPGNLGAILRVADGAGVDAVIICGDFKDIYNPNIIRSSVGCVFSVPVVVATPEQAKAFGDKHKIEFFGAALTPAAQSYTDCDFSGAAALIVGTESSGLGDFWLSNSQLIKIPMLGRNDSLNVATATAVLAYEVVRQRQ